VVLSTKRLVAAAKFLVAATKLLLVPNFVAAIKPFLSVNRIKKPTFFSYVFVGLETENEVLN